MTSLSTNNEPVLRTDLMEQVPQIAFLCQDHPDELGGLVTANLIPIVVKFLTDSNDIVRKTSQAALLVLLEQELVSHRDVQDQVCPVILDLTEPDAIDYFKTEAVALMSKMSPLVGKEMTERLFMERFTRLCSDTLFQIRKVCAANFGEFSGVVGTNSTESVLLPYFLNLCEDGVWGVRKACADVFTVVSCACSLDTRKEQLSSLFVSLLSDESRWVRLAAFQRLGPFISTFADPSVTGLHYNEEGVLFIGTRPEDSQPCPPLDADSVVCHESSNEQSEFSRFRPLIFSAGGKKKGQMTSNESSRGNPEESQAEVEEQTEEEESKESNCPSVKRWDNWSDLSLSESQNDSEDPSLRKWFASNRKWRAKSHSDSTGDCTVLETENVSCLESYENCTENSRTLGYCTENFESIDEPIISTKIFENSKAEFDLSENSKLDLLAEEFGNLFKKSINTYKYIDEDKDNYKNNLNYHDSETSNTPESDIKPAKVDEEKPAKPSNFDDVCCNSSMVEFDPLYNELNYWRLPLPVLEEINSHLKPTVNTIENCKTGFEPTSSVCEENREDYLSSNLENCQAEENVCDDSSETECRSLIPEVNTETESKPSPTVQCSDITEHPEQLEQETRDSACVHISNDEVSDKTNPDNKGTCDNDQLTSELDESSKEDTTVQRPLFDTTTDTSVYCPEERTLSLSELCDNVIKSLGTQNVTEEERNTVQNPTSDSTAEYTLACTEGNRPPLKEFYGNLELQKELEKANYQDKPSFYQDDRGFRRLEQLRNYFLTPDEATPTTSTTFTINQDIVPKSLLEHYISMTDPLKAETVDDEITRHCAYSLPAVALTLGRGYWFMLRKTYETLASDMHWKVRRTLAFSLHELALILGSDLTQSDLVPVFEGFIKDLDEVRIGVLKHLAPFLRTLPPAQRRLFLPRLSEFLTPDNVNNWRFRLELALQLAPISELFSPKECWTHICPITLDLMADKVVQIRRTCFGVVSQLMEHLLIIGDYDDSFVRSYASALVDGFASADTWTKRQSFVYIVGQVIRCCSVPATLVEELLLPAFLDLAGDKVPNIRLVVAKIIKSSILTHEFSEYFIRPEMDGRLQETLIRLQNDTDRDVQYFASFEVDSEVNHDSSFY